MPAAWLPRETHRRGLEVRADAATSTAWKRGKRSSVPSSVAYRSGRATVTAMRRRRATATTGSDATDAVTAMCCRRAAATTESDATDAGPPPEEARHPHCSRAELSSTSKLDLVLELVTEEQRLSCRGALRVCPSASGGITGAGLGPRGRTGTPSGVKLRAGRGRKKEKQQAWQRGRREQSLRM